MIGECVECFYLYECVDCCECVCGDVVWCFVDGGDKLCDGVKDYWCGCVCVDCVMLCVREMLCVCVVCFVV